MMMRKMVRSSSGTAQQNQKRSPSQTYIIKKKVDVESKFKSESMRDNQHINESIPKLYKGNKKMIKLRRDFLTKIILITTVIGRCSTAKDIEGLTVENKIQKGNLQDKYFVEQSNKEMIRE